MAISLPDPQGVDTPTELAIDPQIENALIERRIILLSGRIDEAQAVYVNAHLQSFQSSELPAHIYISSEGGDVAAGYSIIDQMEVSLFPVITIIRGQAMSMGAMIAMYGSPGLRFITKNSVMMIHEMQVDAGLKSISDHKKNILEYGDRYIKNVTDLAKRTKCSSKKLLEIMEKSELIDPKEAIKIGLVDRIWTKSQERLVCSARWCL